MKIKIKEKIFQTARIPKYNKLVNQLEMILRNNKNKRTYHGICLNNKLGILVCGIGSQGIGEFIRFYTIRDINYYYNRNIRTALGT